MGNGAGGHDAGNGAGVAGKKGKEPSAAEADFVHDPIHQVCCASHVAGAFKKADKEKEESDLWKKDEDSPDSGYDAINDETLKIPLANKIPHRPL